MRCLRAVVVSSLVVVGCGESAAPKSPSEPKAPKSAPLTLEPGADSGQVDRVGVADGSLKPDGVVDLSFRLTVDGAIKAVFLVAVDKGGAASGQFQADTLVGDEEVPKVISTKWGGGTAGVGVVDQGALVNAPNGSLSLPASGRRELALYISRPPALAKGAWLRAYVQRPDGAVEASNILVIAPN